MIATAPIIKDSGKAVVERQCIATGTVSPKETLLRFVVGPENRLVPDIVGKLPGRGIWVACARAALDQAIAKRAFQRSAKLKNLTIPDGLADTVAEQLRQRSLSMLALSRKAGQAICGSEKVKDAMAKGAVIGLLHASDASPDGVYKLGSPEGLEVCHGFSREELSGIMGGDNVCHIAILDGQAGMQLLKELRRFTGFVKTTAL